MSIYHQTDLVTLYQGDCLEVMPQLEARSFDAIICDLPYGTTACKWDSVIPFEPLWEQYKRLIKPNGAIVLFGSQPFTTDLIMSNRAWFKYCWVWEKSLPTGFLDAKRKPLKVHEDIAVFSDGRHNYHPVMRKGLMRNKKSYGLTENYGKFESIDNVNDDYYPTTLLSFSGASQFGKVHSTQKPVALLKYLAKTYTRQGDLILDNCFGSCSTGIACLETNRRFVGIEKDPGYFEIGVNRIQQKTEEINQMLIPPWLDEQLQPVDYSADQIPIPL